MESKSVAASSSGNMKLPRIVIRKELHSLIETVKKIQSVTTYEEVLDGLKVYIWQKKLYDPRNPFKICCKDDELGSVLGTKEFTIFDVKFFLQKLVFPADKSNKDSEDSCHLSSSSDCCWKRKSDESSSSDPKKVCNVGLPLSPSSPMILHIPPSPAKHDNSSDSAHSIQGYETAYVKDTSDDVLSADSEEFLSCSERILAIEETYNLEYEVGTDSESSDSSDSYSSDDSEINFEALKALDTNILTVIRKADSDIEFFADDSSDAESEIPESDHWVCEKCNSNNDPTMRKCCRCWEERQAWLPDSSPKTQEKSPPKKKRKKRSRNSRIVSKNEDSEESASPLTPNSVQEGTSSTFQGDSGHIRKSSYKQCIICCSKPANASIIHGKYAHQISCYQCARKLQKKKKKCPICRRTIDKVVHQIA